jgi:hypothetical protein
MEISGRLQRQDNSRLRCNAVWSGRNLATFRKNYCLHLRIYPQYYKYGGSKFPQRS